MAPASRAAFMAAYVNAPYQARTLDSEAKGLGTIGHRGYFRPAAQRLWDEPLDWFECLRLEQRAARKQEPVEKRQAEKENPALAGLCRLLS